ncbi:MAG: murein L,D-transpeptidase catalytic domain family protein [Gemmatimonadaceae bacterium]
MRPCGFARRSLLGGVLFAASVAISAPDLGASSERTAHTARSASPADQLYDELALEGVLARDAFTAAYERLAQTGVEAPALAIADMRRPSTEPRLVIVDLHRRTVALRTWVAHGAGSGDLFAERFSNTHDSHQTSLGLYRVGARIRSPRHGPALLLEGLDPGLNDQARVRQVLIHGADYVSEAFIARTGRLGRSWGCPAVPRDQMVLVAGALADGGYLYLYGA